MNSNRNTAIIVGVLYIVATVPPDVLQFKELIEAGKIK